MASAGNHEEQGLGHEADDAHGKDRGAGSRHRRGPAEDVESGLGDGARPSGAPSPGPGMKVLLLFLGLNTLQNMPLGLGLLVKLRMRAFFSDSSVPEQTFALATWAFGLRILWAPIVDGCYSNCLGRRKSWIVPTHVLVACLLSYLSSSVEGLLQDGNYTALTTAFTLLYVLCASQGTAVDGWGVSLLHKRATAGYVSVCSYAGQALGLFLGAWGPDLVSMSLASFTALTAVLFLAGGLLVVVGGTDDSAHADTRAVDVRVMYRRTLALLRLRPVQIFSLILLTSSIAFTPTDEMALAALKDVGMPEASIAQMEKLGFALDMVLPWAVCSMASWTQPLVIVHMCYLPRTVLTVAAALLPLLLGSIPEPVPLTSWLPVFLMVLVHRACKVGMSVASGAFFATVCDRRHGGSYMALLRTLQTAGSHGAVVATRLVADGFQYQTGYSGFLCVSLICSILGFAWFLVGGEWFFRLQAMEIPSWRVATKD